MPEEKKDLPQQQQDMKKKVRVVLKKSSPKEDQGKLSATTKSPTDAGVVRKLRIHLEGKTNSNPSSETHSPTSNQKNSSPTLHIPKSSSNRPAYSSSSYPSQNQEGSFRASNTRSSSFHSNYEGRSNSGTYTQRSSTSSSGVTGGYTQRSSTSRSGENGSDGYSQRSSSNSSYPRSGGGGFSRPGGSSGPGRPGGGGFSRPGGSSGPGRPGGGGFSRPGGSSGPGRSGGGGFSRPGGSSGPGRPGGGGFSRPGGSSGPGRPGGGGFSRPGGSGGGRPPSNGSSSGQPVFDRAEQKGRRVADYRSKRDTVRRFSPADRLRNEKEIQLQRNKKAFGQKTALPSSITVAETLTVADLARKMNLKASDLITKLMSMGVMATINQTIDAETATILGAEYGCEVKVHSLYDETLIVSEEDQVSDLLHRPPVVTVMGHVDHGKTKLLDAIRSMDVVSMEHGGITQHIGAYLIHHQRGAITFLDTPGHEAFTMMRARGAQLTDIVVLVVAANDGVMPQTIEAIHHAKEAKVPIIVALNKMDLSDAKSTDHLKQQLSDHGLVPEDWGGNTIYVPLSALKKEGIDQLLEMVLLQSDLMELKANPHRRAEGHVLESRIDPGRGNVCTIIVQKGTLRVGDPFVAGACAGKVRALFDDKGEKIALATPSMPVEVLGFDTLPDAGDPFQVTEIEKDARIISEKRQDLKRLKEAQRQHKVTLSNLYDSISKGEMRELKVIVKGDVHGSVEALRGALEKLSNEEIALKVIHAAAGAITASDVNLAVASEALVIAFHVRPTAQAQALATQNKVSILRYNVIYHAVEDIRAHMIGLLDPELQETGIGEVEVREIFKVPKIGQIAGSYVLQGVIRRNSLVRVMREGIQVHEGKISSLRRFKDDAKEVTASYECGVGLVDYQDLQVGDILEAYEIKEVKKQAFKSEMKVPSPKNNASLSED